MPAFNFQASRQSGLLSAETLQTYINDDTVRTSSARNLNSSDATPREDAQFDPIEAMKAGVQVLRYEATSQSFEYRVLKCDDRLNFLYVLAENVDLRKVSVKECPTIRVDSILQILKEQDAVNVFHELGISDQHITTQSASVIKYGAVGSFYMFDNSICIMAAPRQQLKRCIEAVIAHAPNQDNEIDHAARYVQNHVRSRALRSSVKQAAGNVLSNIRLKDNKALLDMAETALTFELTFQKDAKDPVEIVVSTTSDDPQRDATRDAVAHNFNTADVTRFVFAVEECMTQRRWLCQGSVMRLGIFSFALESAHTAVPLAMDDSFHQVRKEITAYVNKSPDAALEKEYAAATARSHFLALRQFCDLEESYSAMCKQANSDKPVMSIANVSQIGQPAQEISKKLSLDLDSNIEDSIFRDIRELKVSPREMMKPEEKQIDNPCPCSSRKADGPCYASCQMQ